MEIRRLQADEGLALRAIRLRALAEAPNAFAETFASAEAPPDSDWHERAQQSAESSRQATFIAVEDGRWLGMASGFLRPESPTTASLVAMWVDPSARQRGVGRMLVASIVDWASAAGASVVQLWATQSNRTAIALYEGMGFVATGEISPCRRIRRCPRFACGASSSRRRRREGTRPSPTDFGCGASSRVSRP